MPRNHVRPAEKPHPMPWCATHARAHLRAHPGVYTAHWRPLAAVTLAQAVRLAMWAGCAGVIQIVQSPCDVCAREREQ